MEKISNKIFQVKYKKGVDRTGKINKKMNKRLLGMHRHIYGENKRKGNSYQI